MMGTILKFGTLLGIFLYLIDAGTLFFFRNPNIRYFVYVVLIFGLIGGMMMFGINEYLKKDQKKIKYNYLVGVAMSLVIGYSGLFNFNLLARIIYGIVVGQSPQFDQLLNTVLSFNLAIFLLAIISPTAFISKSKKSKDSIGDNDILDAGF